MEVPREGDEGYSSLSPPSEGGKRRRGRKEHEASREEDTVESLTERLALLREAYEEMAGKDEGYIIVKVLNTFALNFALV